MTGVDPGSFRDRRARVLHHEGAVLRALDAEGLAEWRAVSRSPAFQRLSAAGRIVGTEEMEPIPLPLPDHRLSAGLLRHETIPYVSYPYEWSFSMLKDAALLHLDLIVALLEDGIIAKDASPYNVQWVGSRPVFIDIGSLRRLRDGEPWPGYRQFCRLFLYPLVLQALRGVPLQLWLRGSAEGMDAETCRRLLRPHDFRRPGIFAHVYLHAKAEHRFGDKGGGVRQDLQAAGFNRQMIRRNVESLQSLVASLHWLAPPSTWSAYAPETIYGRADIEEKVSVVQRIMASRSWNLVWDLGCNTGMFARIAADHARYVVAFDSEQAIVDNLYRRLKADGVSPRLLPLVVNLVDPSPRSGWRTLEHRALEDRGVPDLALCLALLHHLVITASVPLTDVLDWLLTLGGHVVIEFVTREDPMVQQLLGRRGEPCDDYDVNHFEGDLAARFTVIDRWALARRTRLLYYARPLRR